jgi:hypothetical protein
MWHRAFNSRRAAIADCWSGRTYHYHVHVSLQLCQEAGRARRTAIFGVGWMVMNEMECILPCIGFSDKLSLLFSPCQQGLHLDFYHAVSFGDVQCFQCY